LVISPHPDDESIGCGGTLRRRIVGGAAVDVIFLTSGERGGHGRDTDETIRIREQEAEAAAAILGVRSITFWREPDGAVSASSQNIVRTYDAIANSNPSTILVTHDEE